MPRVLRAFISLAGVSALAGGCGGGTGELGRAQFAWSDNYTCLAGCPIVPSDGALVAGGHAQIVVKNHGSLPAFSVRSTDPAVLVFTTVSTGRVEAFARLEGQAALELVDVANRSVIDRVTVTVRAAATLDVRFVDGLMPQASNALLEWSEVALFFAYRDATSQVLRGIGAYVASASGAAVDGGFVPGADVVEGFASIFGPAPDALALVTGGAASGSLTLTSGVANRAVSFEVVPEATVSSIAVVRADAATILFVGDTTRLSAEGATVAGAPVYGMRCTAWNLSNPGVVSLLPGGTAARQTLTAEAPGETDVTCALGPAAGTLHFVVGSP